MSQLGNVIMSSAPLLLYSQLFRRITDLPGFGTVSYVDYLTPGVAIMTAFSSSASCSGRRTEASSAGS